MLGKQHPLTAPFQVNAGRLTLLTYDLKIWAGFREAGSSNPLQHCVDEKLGMDAKKAIFAKIHFLKPDQLYHQLILAEKPWILNNSQAENRRRALDDDLEKVGRCTPAQAMFDQKSKVSSSRAESLLNLAQKRSVCLKAGWKAVSQNSIWTALIADMCFL